MNDATRNSLVGLTVLAGLVLLGALIVSFASSGPWQESGYEVRLEFPAAASAKVGDPIHLRGLPIGTVKSIGFTGDDAAVGITVVASIRQDVDIPGNARAYIFSKGITGQALIDLRPETLKADKARPAGPATRPPLASLPKDGSATIAHGQVRTGIQLPPELEDSLDDMMAALKSAQQGMASLSKVGDAAEVFQVEIQGLSKQLSQFIGKKPPDTGTGVPPASLMSTLQRLDKILMGLETTFGKPSTEKGFDDILANLVDASARATKALEAWEAMGKQGQALTGDARKAIQTATDTLAGAGKNVDRITTKLVETSGELSKLLATLNRIALQIESGKGTAGKLVGDPKLYSNLLDSTRQLTLLVKDLRDLVEYWKKRGVGVKLK